MSNSRLPLSNLIIAGLPKCGTTSLFGYLDSHPEICGSSIKEPNFFTPTGHTGSLSLEEYSALFSANPSATWRMEASVHYFWGGTRVAQQIASTLTEPRVIISLREPARRLWSGYTFTKSRGITPPEDSFSRTVDRWELQEAEFAAGLRENPSPLGHSQYATYLTPWLDIFGDNLRVLFLENMASNVASEMAKLYEWLVLTPVPTDQADYGRKNPTLTARSRLMARAAHGARRRTNTWFRNLPMFRDLLRSAYQKVNTTSVSEHMDDETAQRIRSWCASSNDELRVLLQSQGYDNLPNWVGPSNSAPRRV